MFLDQILNCKSLVDLMALNLGAATDEDRELLRTFISVWKRRVILEEKARKKLTWRDEA
jgi:hypothetical protein